MPFIGLSPEIIEIAVAFLLIHTVDNVGWVVGDQWDFGQFNQVYLYDQNSVLRVGGEVV